jgi:addiction module RelE/StbE family toxin
MNETPLPPNYEDHPLKGDLEGFRDCHIEKEASEI